MTREEAIERFNGIINAMSISIAQSKFYPSKAELDELCDKAIEALSEPSGDLISRQDAIDGLVEAIRDGFFDDFYDEDVAERIMIYVPSADRPQGEWIFKDDYEPFAGQYFCSNCDTRAEVDPYGEWILSNYCPNCGARMEATK